MAGDLSSKAGSLSELAREIEALRADPAALAAFVAELPGLAELTRKVRLTGGDESGGLTHAAVLEDAKELLVARLSELGGT